MKVETDIVGRITMSPIEREVIVVLTYVETFKTKLNKIRSLTCSTLLICRSMGDLRKLHYGSHEGGSMYHPLKMAKRHTP